MSSVLSWDSTALRAPSIPWAPMLHHRPIKQEPMEGTMTSSFVSNHSEGFHSASPSSSSRDSNPQSPCSVSPTPSVQNQQGNSYRIFTPTSFEESPEAHRNQPASQQASTNTVTPPKSPSPSWINANESVLSPVNSIPENEDEPGVRVPAVNSHGKVKTFKCKQCDFIAVTKLNFWEHTKSHIKPERMLNCPKCPFVTEYKHHLEYHMRNHFGSKPFQCSQCPYSCVNKSMLNSHLKSHSNVYQYRCADCNYATKYCHSLKLHLRKYQHLPAMVLNQDGTPNPLPIIDVYGTRRGPKQRNQGKSHDDHPSRSVSPVAAAPHSIFQSPFGVNFSYGQLIQHPMLFPHNNNLNEPSLLSKSMQSPKREDENCGSIQPVSSHMLLQPRFLPEYNNQIAFSPRNEPTSPRSPIITSPPRQSPMICQNGADPLDLTSNNNKQPDNNNSTTMPLTPPASTKNRRKGRAFKLEKVQTDDEDDGATKMVMQNLQENQVEEIEVSVDIPKFSYDSGDDKDKMVSSPEPMEACEQEQEACSSSAPKESYDCAYCGIIFKDLIMYTMHMGYHGFKDPFTCNMCGTKSGDKVSFFIHIARSPHS